MQNPFIEPVTVLGEALGRRETYRFGIKRSDRFSHTYILGQTGTGKSTLMRNMMAQDIRNSQGFCLIDPHGDLAQQVLAPAGERCIYWDLADPDCSLGYNPMGYVHQSHRPIVASAIIDTLKQQWSDAWGVRMEHLLRFALLALLEFPNSNLQNIVPMFTDKGFRSHVLVHVTDPVVCDFWMKEFPQMNYKNALDGVAPIANKLGAFLANPLVRKAICEPKEPIGFRKLMDEGQILIINLSKGRLGADTSNIIGGLAISMLVHAGYSRQNIMESRRRPFMVYADEFHSFTTEAFAGALSELRKYKLGMVLVAQHTTQSSQKVSDAIFGNAGTLISFRVGAKDAPLVAKQLGVVKPRDLTDLSNFKAYLKLMVDGEPHRVVSMQTLNNNY